MFSIDIYVFEEQKRQRSAKINIRNVERTKNVRTGLLRGDNSSILCSPRLPALADCFA